MLCCAAEMLCCSAGGLPGPGGQARAGAAGRAALVEVEAGVVSLGVEAAVVSKAAVTDASEAGWAQEAIGDFPVGLQAGAADGGASGAMPAAWAAAGQNAPSGRCDQTSHSLRRVPNYHC